MQIPNLRDFRILKSFSHTPEISYVRGHQDYNKAYNALSLEEQLNVDADKLAGSYEYPPGVSHTKVLPIEGVNILLHSQQGTIGSRYHRAIRKLSNSNRIRQYIIKKNNWGRQFDYVDWTSHGIAIRNKYTIKHFLTKYVHD